MTAQERLERVLKDLYALCDIARKGAHGATALDDKVEMRRTVKALEQARTHVRAQHFQIKDAERYADGVTNCPTCGDIVSKDLIDQIPNENHHPERG